MYSQPVRVHFDDASSKANVTESSQVYLSTDNKHEGVVTMGSIAVTHHEQLIQKCCVLREFSASGGPWLSEQSSLTYLHKKIFFFTFHNCTVPMGFLPWEIQVAFPRASQL